MNGLVFLAIVALLLAGPDVLATGAATVAYWFLDRMRGAA